MSMNSGNRPPGNGAWNRPHGPYPPMPGNSSLGAPPPPRFIAGPPTGPHGRVPGPGTSFNGANSYPPAPPPYPRNGSPYPPRQVGPAPSAPPPYQQPPFPPVNGAPRRWSMQAAPVHARNGHPDHSIYAPPARRYPSAAPPNGYTARPHQGPPGVPPVNGYYDPPQRPHNAPANPIERVRTDLQQRPSYLPPSNGRSAPSNAKRAFTPVQDYLAGTDLVSPPSRTPAVAPQSNAPAVVTGFTQDLRANGARVDGLDLTRNPLPLGEDYSERALAELAYALENSMADSGYDADIPTGDAIVASYESVEHDRSLAHHSWSDDTITPEKLETLRDRSDLSNLSAPSIADDPLLMEKKQINPRSPRAALEPERVPQPMRRSKRARHPLVIAGNLLFTLLVLLAIAVGGVVVVGKQRLETAGPLEDDKVVTIPKGLGTRDIADLLVQEGVIDQPWIFMGGVFVLKARDGLKAGEYQFTKHASLREVIGTIVDGKVVQHQFTLAEGLTSEQIVQRILDSDLLTGNIREIPREGSLLPETYKVTRGTSREQVIQRMEAQQQRAVQEIWEHRMPGLPLKTPEELVTLASIVEKETGRTDERSRVAAVFINRLKQRMRLQSDPTIIYGLVGGKGSLGRPISRSDIEQPTPYNTYAIDGLPPGPIANPGRASLEAVANPARTKDLYFVADGTGGHAFAETLEQHQKNVAHLRQIEQQQKEAPWPVAPTTQDPKRPRASLWPTQ